MSSIGGIVFNQLACPALPAAVRMWTALQGRMLAGPTFGAAEHDRVKQTLRVRFPALSSIANGRAGETAFNYMMMAILSEALKSPGLQRPTAAAIQSAAQQYQSAVSTIARIMKTAHDDALAILSNLKA